jgi:hypothetical protein
MIDIGTLHVLQDFTEFLNVVNKNLDLHNMMVSRLILLNNDCSKITKPSELRPLGILSVVSKILEILDLEYTKDTLDVAQTGFKRGATTSINMMKLQELKTSYRKTYKLHFALFIDFEKAFPRVNHFRMFEEMKNEDLHL